MNAKSRILDIVAIGIIAIGVLNSWMAGEYYGGTIAQLTFALGAIASCLIAWRLFVDKHWMLKIFGGYIGIALNLLAIQILVVELIEGQYAGFAANLIIFVLWFCVWYFIFIRKAFPKTEPAH